LGHTILSPTFAAAKGIGSWDIQSTVGANLPATGANLLGRAIVFNTAVDYRIKGKIWPMLEQNSMFRSRRGLGRKEGGLLDTRPRGGQLSIGRATPSHRWRGRADRRHTVPPVRSPLDSFRALTVLSSCLSELPGTRMWSAGKRHGT
jgi:hypothetical protein